MSIMAPVLLSFQWLVMAFVGYLLVVKADWRQHIPFLFGLLLLHLFVGVVPLYFWLFGPHTLLSYPYHVQFNQASSIYLLGFVAFATGYLALNTKKKINETPSMLLSQPVLIKALLALLFVCWVGVLVNFHLSGVQLLEVFNPANRTPSAMLFSIPIYNGLLEALANSFIAILLILFALSKRKWWVVALIAVHLAFFFIAGWRFRIMLTLLGLGIYYLPNLSRQSIWKWLAACMLGFVLMLWVSQNRMAFSKRMFHLVQWSVSDYDLFHIMHEVGSCRTFMATLRHMEQNNIGHDWGASFYLPLYWRLQPSENFPGGIRPKPPLLELEKAWIPAEVTQNLNPGVCNLEEYYLSLGWLGLVVLMATFGMAIHLIPKERKTPIQTAAQMVFTSFLFQFISRGYLPQQLKLLAFLGFPFLLVVISSKIFAPAARVDTPHGHKA